MILKFPGTDIVRNLSVVSYIKNPRRIGILEDRIRAMNEKMSSTSPGVSPSKNYFSSHQKKFADFEDIIGSSKQIDELSKKQFANETKISRYVHCIAYLKILDANNS